MIYCYYIGVSLCLVILQTAVLPYVPLLDRLYDLIIAFVIYLGLYRPLRDGLILSFFLGFIMDNLSGSPFGLYLTIYCWLLIGAKSITTLIQVDNRDRDCCTAFEPCSRTRRRSPANRHCSLSRLGK